MDVIIVMCLGVLAGKFFFPEKWKRINEILQTVCTVLLIFSMGVMLGSRENFISEISELGMRSVLFFLIPSVTSVIIVYPLTRIFLDKKSQKNFRIKEKVNEGVLRYLADYVSLFDRNAIMKINNMIEEKLFYNILNGMADISKEILEGFYFDNDFIGGREICVEA